MVHSQVKLLASSSHFHMRLGVFSWLFQLLFHYFLLPFSFNCLFLSYFLCLFICLMLLFFFLLFPPYFSFLLLSLFPLSLLFFLFSQKTYIFTACESTACESTALPVFGVELFYVISIGRLSSIGLREKYKHLMKALRNNCT